MKLTHRLLMVGAASAAQIMSPITLASEQYAVVEFDDTMLWRTPGEKPAIDVTRFNEGNPVPAGAMTTDLYVNGQLQRKIRVYFMPIAGKKSAEACFTPQELVIIGLAGNKLPAENAQWLQSDKTQADCRLINAVVPDATAVYDFSEQRLELSIPQAYLLERPKDFIDPRQWDRGITAGRLNYSVDAFNSNSNGRSSNQTFASLESGFNTHGWRLRNFSTLTADKKNNDFQAQRTYAETDVEQLNGTLTLGQTYTDGQLFDSYGLQGAFLATDMRMLPASLRNYAPVVSGTADTNAKVTIRQNNTVVYERAVAPGPFEITNLYTVGYGNDLVVTVTEADGSTKTFSVPYSPLVQLLRPGQSKYAASLGQAWSPTHERYTPTVGQLYYQYGINNALTAFSGAIVSDDYTSLALGGAVSTYLGGLSADYTVSDNRLDSTDSSNGNSMRFVYSTLIAPTETNITLSSYRFSSRGFWSFNDMLANENNRLGMSREDYEQRSFYGAKQKGRFDINLRQRLAPGYGNLSASGSTRNFWNRDGSDTQYQLSYGNQYKDLSYTLSATRVKDQYERRDNEFRLSISVPIFASDYGRRHYLSSSLWHHSERGTQAQASVGGIAGDDQQINYGISTTQGLDSKNAQRSYGLNGNYRGSKALLSGSATNGQDYQQTTLSIAGAVLAHAGGVTFGQTLGETVALVEASDAAGARITNAAGLSVDGNGFGVVPNLSAYSRNRVEIDPQGLSREVQLDVTSSETIPTAGSIVRVRFDTSRQTTLLVRGTLADGAPLPFAAEVINKQTQASVGFVGQGGTIFARGIEAQGQLVVKLKEGDCQITYSVDPAALSDATATSSTPVVCLPE